MAARPFERTLAARAHRAVSDVVGNAIGLVSPSAACRYFRSRASLYEIKRRGYEAGKPGGPNANWRPVNGTADAHIARDGDRLRARARDLVRNDPRIKGAVAILVNNCVRTGIWPQAAFKTRTGEPDKALRAAVESLWHSWAPRAQVVGGSIYAAERLGLRHCIKDGEYLVHALWSRRYPVLPLRFELIEADQLDSSMDGPLKGGNVIRRGVEYGQDGSPVAYWVLPYHPGEGGLWSLKGLGRSSRIPAEDCKLIFHRERISQTRGVSWLDASALRAFDLTEYDTYEMIGAKLAAAFGVFFTQGQGEGLDTFSPSSPSDRMPEFIEPGMMRTLPPGSDVKIAEHNRPGNNYDAFVASNARAVASGMGMSYETFSKDYSRSTFSSARQAILEERTGYRCMQDFLCEEFMAWIWERFLFACALSGKVSLPGFEREPWTYTDAVVWQVPGWSWIDPVKDSKASEQRINLGISSRTREAREQGADFEESVAEQLREEELLVKLAEARAKRLEIESKISQAGRPAKKGTGNASA